MHLGSPPGCVELAQMFAMTSLARIKAKPQLKSRRSSSDLFRRAVLGGKTIIESKGPQSWIGVPTR